MAYVHLFTQNILDIDRGTLYSLLPVSDADEQNTDLVRERPVISSTDSPTG